MILIIIYFKKKGIYKIPKTFLNITHKDKTKFTTFITKWTSRREKETFWCKDFLEVGNFLIHFFWIIITASWTRIHCALLAAVDSSFTLVGQVWIFGKLGILSFCVFSLVAKELYGWISRFYRCFNFGWACFDVGLGVVGFFLIWGCVARNEVN